MSIARAARLSGSELTAAMTLIPRWALHSPEASTGRDVIRRSIEFPNFQHAWSFMSAIALRAEVKCHHPEWFNVYGRVDITLTTHDSSGVTEKDVDLAQTIDSYADKLGGKDASKRR